MSPYLRSSGPILPVDERPFGLELVDKTSFDVAGGRTADDLAMTRVAHEWWGPRTRLLMNSPKMWMLALGIRGEVRLRSDAVQGDFGPGHLVVFSPHDRIEVAVVGEQPWEMLLVTGNGYGLREAMREHLGMRSRALRLGNANRVEQIITAAMAAAQDGGPFTQQICTDYLRILIMTAHQGSMQIEPQVSPALNTFAQAKAHVDRHFTELHSAQDIAAACGINRGYLSRLFRSYAQDSPYAYLQRLKMNHAAHLLTTTSDTLQVIASELGYADAFSFSKAFSRQFGISPSAYRGARS